MQYSRARYYDPRSREFIGQDPLGFVAGDTNLYRRVGNSPVNATDPSGMLAPAVVLYWAVGGAAASANAYIWPKNIKMAVDIANGDPVDINDSPYSSQYRSELATRTATGAVVGTSVAVGVPVLARALPTSASGYYWAGAGIASHRLAVPLAEGVVEVASGYQGPGLFPSPGAVIDDAGRFLGRGLRATESPNLVVEGVRRFADDVPHLTDDALEALRVVAQVRTAGDDFVTVFRGDRAGTTVIKSHAASEGGYAHSQRLIAEGNLDDLFRSHAADSKSPASPFISVTTDRRVAEFYAGPNGVVSELRIPVSRATPNPHNNLVIPAGPAGRLIPESELLVPNYVRPSEILRRTKR